MKLAPVLVGSLVLVVGACSSASQDRGLEGPGVGNASAAPDVNPDGVPYPLDDIGTSARTAAHSGNRIANYKFLGYPNADKSQGLQPLSLAQYYDPSGARYLLIHIQAAGVWCSACQAETKVVVPLAQQLTQRKAVWLVSLAEGPTPNQPSKQSDLDNWMATYKSPFTHFLDPSNANLGPFYDRSALPWNANIDAKTMEILTSATGAATTTAGILDDIDSALQATQTPLKQ